MHPRPYMHYPGGRPQMNSMMRGPGRPAQMSMRPQTKQGGGLLSKLLGKGSQTNGMRGISTLGQVSTGAREAGLGTGGGLLKNISNPSTINGFLANTQKVLNTAGQIAPMVQQYGPMVRNIPAMWKLYKGFKDLPNENSNEKNDDLQSNNEEVEETVPEIKTKKKVQNVETKRKNNVSTPKLYI